MSHQFTDSDSVIVILGGSNDAAGILSQMSLDRCEKAYALHLSYPTLRLVTTGGWGEHFNQTSTAHGELVKQELMRRGIPEALFFAIPPSSYTKADATETAKVLCHENFKQILLVTSDFHMDRAIHYFRLVFKDMTIIPSPATSTLPADELKARTLHEKMRLEAIQEQEKQGE